MKITVSKNELLGKLRILGKVLQPKNTLPAYDDFLFVIDENGFLTITAGEEGGRMLTDIVCRVDCTDLKFTVNARTLLEALKEIPEQPIVMEIHPTDKCVELNCNYSNGKFSLLGKLGMEYPDTPFIDPGFPQVLKVADFLYGIRQVKICCANDELRPVMNGVYFDRDLDKITYVASNGSTLAMVERPAAHISERNSFIIPARYAQILASAIPAGCEELSVTVASSNACFEFDNYRLVFRLIEGRYPNYRAVLPNDNDKEAIVALDSLISAIKRTSVFSNPNSLAVKLSFTDSLLIQVQDIDYSTSAEETVGLVSYKGANIEIGFRSTYLIESLSSISSEKVRITMKQVGTATIITPEGEDNGLLYLIMPMSINF